MNLFQNTIIKQTKNIIVFSPEQCPFRYTALYYDGEEEYCSYLKSLHKVVEEQIIIDDKIISHEEDADATCFCTDDRWIEGCPLLKDNFQIVKQ